MACRLFDTKSLITPVLTYCEPEAQEHIPVKLYLKVFLIQEMHFTKSLITPVLTYCEPEAQEHIPVKLYLKVFLIQEMHFKLSSAKYMSATGTLSH